MLGSGCCMDAEALKRNALSITTRERSRVCLLLSPAPKKQDLARKRNLLAALPLSSCLALFGAETAALRPEKHEAAFQNRISTTK